MDFKRIFLYCFVSVSVFAGAIGLHSRSGAKQPLVFPKGSTYDKEWKKVDSLMNKGLTKSALEVVMGIYNRSKSEKNAAQTVKAIMHKLRLEQQMEEYSMEKAIGFLKNESVTSGYPLRPVIHSMLGDIYWQYYTNNRWKFYNRTQTINFSNNDITTWDLNHLVDQSIKEYQLSLKSVDSLRNTPLNIYDDVLNQYPDARKFRPTLYDFLVHRAIDFFSFDEPDITHPAYQFSLDQPDYLVMDRFLNLKLENKDSMSMKFYALKNLQELVRFHEKDENPVAFVDDGLKYLAFVKAHATFPEKDSLYLKSLLQFEEQIAGKHPGADCISEIGYEIAAWHEQLGAKYAPLNSDQYKWERKTAIELCRKTIQKYPNAYGSKECAVLEARILEKTMTLTTEKVNAPNKPIRALFASQNMNKVFIRIAKMDYDKFTHMSERYYGEELIRQYLKLPVMKEWELSIPDDGDHAMHSEEIKLPELPYGHYIVLTGSDKSFSMNKEGVAYASFWVSDISYMSRQMTNSSYDFYVLHRQTGEPLKNVKAQLWIERYNNRQRAYEWVKSDVFTSDENGYFNIPSPADYRNFNVEFTNGTDKFYLDNSYYQYKNYKQEKQKVSKTFFFTDRGIYRPGQTIYFKGICISTDGETSEIQPHKAVTVNFYDVNSQKLSSLDLTTNEYGSITGSFTAPQGVMNGQMWISDSYGSKYFSVEEYKRPKFEVTVKPVVGTFRLGDEVKVAGIAKAYSGANIDGAQVKYRVVRNASFPYWCYWWRGYYPHSAEMEITNGFTTTNDTGGYFIHFTALSDKSVSNEFAPTYTYSVIVDVTDLNGETHNSTGYVRVGYKAMTMEIGIPEQVNKDEHQKYVVSTLNLNGEFEPAKGRIQIYKLKDPGRTYRKRTWERPDRYLLTKEEFNAAFPLDAYKEEDNMYKWERGEKVLETTFNNTRAVSGSVLSPRVNDKSDTLFLNDVKQWPQGYYVMEAHTTDRYGEDVKDIKYFTVYSEHETSIGNNDIDYFSPLKVSGEPGEKAKILVGSRDNVKMLFELEYKNSIIKKEWVNLDNRQKLLEIPIEEKDRGGFAYHFVFVRNNRSYQHDGAITVPWTNKELDIEFETFRNKLEPGQQEEWRLKLKGKKGEKVAAEMLTTMYDASLDAFAANYWDFNIYNSFYSGIYWAANESFGIVNTNLYADKWNSYPASPYRYYESLNWFGYYNYGRYRGYYGDEGAKADIAYSKASASPAMPGEAEEKVDSMKSMDGNTKNDSDKKERGVGGKFGDVTTATGKDSDHDGVPDNIPASGKKGKESETETVKARSNFAETAFFFPTLTTDDKGEVIVKFTVPEALTRWKMMGFAHTKDLKYGSIGNTLVTQKELMVVPNAPRFFREGDKMTFTCKISSLADSKLEGNAKLLFFDALTQKPVDDQLFVTANSSQAFTVAKGGSTVLSWDIKIPEGLGAITYRVLAKAGNFSDGEEMPIPVLTNRMLVTESMPLPIRSKQTKTFTFEKFISQNNHSTTLRNHKLTLEFTANPAWYAVQALPYLMEYPYECAEQTFSRFYANSIASHIANSSPKIKAVFDSWRTQSPDALLSNLQKNQELKSLMLEETPWVLDAKDESERKKRVALLFDMVKMSTELDAALRKLQKMQTGNGGWPWFEGMPDDRYITQHIITGMGHLDHLGVKNIRSDSKTWNMVLNGVLYLDDRMREDYEWILKYDKAHLNDDHLGYEEIQYLYARSYFLDIPINKRNQTAFDYYKGQARKYWLNKGRYMQGMIALALKRNGDKSTPMDIIKSLKENSISNEEMGMYWKENYDGFYWYQAPIESQALLIEAFDEVANDQKSVDDLKVWLLKSKQTQDWKTTKATTEACYALLLRGTDWLATESNVEISLGDMKIDPKKMDDVKVEAGTGYFKTSWSGSDIKPEMGKVTVSKKDEGVSWGAVYWQYFEQLDKITPHETPLKLNKKLFVERNTAAGPVIEPVTSTLVLKPGDKIKVRIELRVDRDMQYVHMKDMRASCFEPTNVISQYKWQDGLGYYESTRDASTNFFFANLPKGNYVFEYPLLVTHNGDFSNGVTSIQCMYAPEFGSHSEGIRVKVGK